MPSVILRKLSVEQSSTQEGTEETPLVNRRRFPVGGRNARGWRGRGAVAGIWAHVAGSPTLSARALREREAKNRQRMTRSQQRDHARTLERLCASGDLVTGIGVLAAIGVITVGRLRTPTYPPESERLWFR